MRQVPGVLLSLAAALGARAYDASVFTFDSYRQTQHLIDPSALEGAAPSLLALRTNSNNDLVLERTDQETVQALNQYGGMPSPLFGDSSRGKWEKNLIILEGINDEAVSSLRKDYSRNLAVSSFSPKGFDDDPLAFLGEARSSKTGADDGHCAFKADSSMGESENLKAAWGCISHDPILQELPHETNKQLLGLVEFAESWVSKSKSMANLRIAFKPGKALPKETLKSFFHDVSAFSHNGREVTVVLMPNTRTFQPSKRDSLPRNTMQRDTAPQARKPQASEAVLSSPLPVCHSTNSSCVDATNNCSGHGFCHRKYKDKEDGTPSDCFACKCQPSVEKNGDGKTRTVRWGGAACQKKDISSPFFLIAGITVMIVAAVATAIGLLFNVGQQELPGVISAGVGPAKPK